jgi:protein-S-isoprenylcysteine O-methyltransferase Ste14
VPSRLTILAESARPFAELVPTLRRPVATIVLVLGVKLGIIACVAAGWWASKQWALGGVVAEAALILFSGAAIAVGFFPHCTSYRERYGDLAYERLLFRYLVPFVVAGAAALLLPAFLSGPPLLLGPVAYGAAAYLLLTAVLIEWRGTELFWNLDLRVFVYSVFPERGQVVTSGLFRWLRHPIYSGFIRFVAGTALVRNNASALGAAGLLVVGVCLLTWLEERDLRRRDPTYAEYRRATPAFFAAWPLPFWRYLLLGP